MCFYFNSVSVPKSLELNELKKTLNLGTLFRNTKNALTKFPFEGDLPCYFNVISPIPLQFHLRDAFLKWEK